MAGFSVKRGILNCSVVLTGVLAFLLIPSSFAIAQAPSASQCTNLSSIKIEDTNLLSASVVPAQGDLPSYCRVLGYVRPAINFEVRLPMAEWNGKFYMAGCGGFCGKLESDRPRFTNAMNYGLRRNYAAAVTDSGHWGTGATDGRWACNNRLAEIDWGYRAITETTRVAKVIVKAFYQKAPTKSYFAGCSTGGRMAMMEAIRFPKDFDGIISGAPALDYTGLVATWASWVVKANMDSQGKMIFDHTKLKLLTDAVYAACDSLDGLADGIINDPSKCTFEPSSLKCSGEPRPDCLTPAQVQTLEKFYQGAVDSSGKRLYPGGYPKGSEPYWPLWVIGDGKAPGLGPLFNADFLRCMAFEVDPGDSYNPLSFDFDRDPQKLQFMGRIYNATNPDLSRFKEVGGKVIMYHGLADSIVTPQLTIDYYNQVIEKMGGLDPTQSFFRLFLIPGMDHCSILPGRGPDTFDVLKALEDWVEKGIAPDQMIATQLDKEGKVMRSRPVCLYPKAVKYKGSGNPDDAASFSCENP